jgi:hypothetical protein
MKGAGVALKAPMPWFGGKSSVADLIWARFGDVANYVDPFCGSLAVLLARPHAPRVETVNDADALLCNFWRALGADPEAVARHADWPVSEVDLHARHLWLLDRKADVARLVADPDWYDARIAGWWVWGLCSWIGSGWCSGRGPWRLVNGVLTKGGDPGELAGAAAQLPHLGNAGMGVNRQLPGDARQLPHLADGGQGINRQLPHLGNAGRGVHRDRHAGIEMARPHLGNGGQGVHRKLPHLGDGGRGDAAPARGELYCYLGALSERLRRVRITCGDWTRVLGPSVTTKHGMTAVLLDPPYAHEGRDDDLYTHDTDIAGEVRAWAVAHGDDPLLRIAYCGYEDGQAWPEGWEVVRWKAKGGYGSQGEGRGRENAAREYLAFSPHCLRPGKPATLFNVDEYAA